MIFEQLIFVDLLVFLDVNNAILFIPKPFCWIEPGDIEGDE